MSVELTTAKELLARLVAFDTTSYKSNIPLIEFVEEYLRRHGVASRRVPTPDGQKASLFATIGPAGLGGIALSGHTDVVPVAGQAWDSDPFTLVERDGKLYGRGACDMKGFLACVLALVPAFTSRALRVPIHIAFSYDEEVGCTGVRPMIAEFGKALQMPRMVLVGEPTSMTVVDAHKGPVRWKVSLTGKAAHSSMPHLGVNAITYAGRLLGELERMEEELKALPPDNRFDPPYTTLQVTEIAGGTASNIVPVPCSFGWEIRRLPGFDGMSLDKRLRAFAAEHCLPEMQRAAPETTICHRNRQRGAGVPRRSQVRHRDRWRRSSPSRTTRSPSATPRRPACSRRAARRPSSSAPATSPRRTPPTSSSRSPSSPSAWRSSAASPTGPRARPCTPCCGKTPMNALLRTHTSVLDVAYEQSGPADGRPIVLLHGWPYDVRAYDAVAPHLAAAGHRVIVPYLRGYGPTRFLAAATVRSGEQAALGQDLVELLDALQIDRAVLAGFDWGGRAACVVAALGPERVYGLVTCTGYQIQDIAGSIKPADPEQEHRFWYQYYFHTERGRNGLTQKRGDLAKLLWRLWSPEWAFDDATFARSAASFDPDFVDVTIHSYRHRSGNAAGDPAYAAIEALLREAAEDRRTDRGRPRRGGWRQSGGEVDGPSALFHGALRAARIRECRAQSTAGSAESICGCRPCREQHPVDVSRTVHVLPDVRSRKARKTTTALCSPSP